jgi:hypothetical protein
MKRMIGDQVLTKCMLKSTYPRSSSIAMADSLYRVRAKLLCQLMDGV